MSKHKLSNAITIIFLLNLLKWQRFTFARSLQRLKISKLCPLHVPCLLKGKQIPFTVLSTAADLHNVVINLIK